MVKSQLIFHGLQFSKHLLSIFLPPKRTWARCYLCRQQLFASLLQQMDILRPSLGHGVINQIQFSSSSSTLPTGRLIFIIHVTASQYLIALCCLIPKNTQTHFFIGVGEHCLLMKEENTKNLRCHFANIASPERFQGLGLFLKERVQNKREGENCDKGINKPRGEDYLV